MKKIKKGLLLITLLLSFLLTVSCASKTYSLSLNNNITANINNLDKIKENTLITLTFNSDINKEIDYILFNDLKIFLSTNTYTFKITTNTTVKAYYKNIDTGFYKLNLPKEVTSNLTSLTNIKKDTLVILNINVPPKRSLRSLRINKESIDILTSSNTYEFKIKEDTTVSVHFDFLDGYKEVGILETLAYGIRLRDLDLIKEGTININGNINNSNINFNFILDEELNIPNLIGYYKENTYFYNNTYTYINNNEGKVYYDGFLLPFKINNIEDLINEAGLIINEELNFSLIASLIKIIFKNLNNQVLKESIFFLEKDNNYKLIALLTKEDLLSFNGVDAFNEIISLLPSFYLELETIIKDDKIEVLDINLSLDEGYDINVILSYTDELIIEPGDLSSYTYSDVSERIINLYINSDLYLELEIKDLIIDYIINEFDFIDYSYLNKFNISGLYTNSNYTSLLSMEDLNNLLVDIYIKWEE